MIKPELYIGKIYGRLTVLDVFRKNKRTYAYCRCICGTIKNIHLYSVIHHRTISCGCYNKEVITKHGMLRTKEYNTWQHMLRRCDTHDPIHEHLYMGKGIRVCERWKKFSNFFEDMGFAPSPIHSMDRLDNNKGYYKGNCRWATPTEQSRNTNRNKIIYFNGEKKCASEWAEIYGIKYQTFLKRLQMGWKIKEALTKPISVSHQRFKH